jgi:DNA polymerase-3 subunit epsilon
MLAEQPLASQIFPEFHHFIGPDPLIAHNAAFDLRFLAHEFSQLGLTLENPHHCTLKLSRRHYPHLRSHKLENLAKHLLGPAATKNLHLHRALDDARLTAKIWLEMMAKRSHD